MTQERAPRQENPKYPRGPIGLGLTFAAAALIEQGGAIALAKTLGPIGTATTLLELASTTYALMRHGDVHITPEMRGKFWNNVFIGGPIVGAVAAGVTAGALTLLHITNPWLIIAEGAGAGIAWIARRSLRRRRKERRIEARTTRMQARQQSSSEQTPGTAVSLLDQAGTFASMVQARLGRAARIGAGFIEGAISAIKQEGSPEQVFANIINPPRIEVVDQAQGVYKVGDSIANLENLGRLFETNLYYRLVVEAGARNITNPQEAVEFLLLQQRAITEQIAKRGNNEITSFRQLYKARLEAEAERLYPGVLGVINRNDYIAREMNKAEFKTRTNIIARLRKRGLVMSWEEQLVEKEAQAVEEGLNTYFTITGKSIRGDRIIEAKRRVQMEAKAPFIQYLRTRTKEAEREVQEGYDAEGDFVNELKDVNARGYFQQSDLTA